MRRTILVLAVVTLAAAMFIPATAAAPPKVPAVSLRAASGLWTEVEVAWNVWKETPKGVQYASGTHDGTWTGTFEGSSVDDWGAQFWPDGTYWIGLAISFEGTVNEKEGTLEILFTGSLRSPDGTPSGKWVIISGTGDLANLHGQGTWSYDFDAEGVRYSGIVKQFIPPS